MPILPSSALDPDDTTACPVEATCAVCEAPEHVEPLAVATLKTDLGLICLTLCPECELGPIPPLSLGRALERVCAHCEHLGADLDAVAAAVAEKDAR